MLARAIVDELRGIVGAEGIIAERAALRTYESDGLTSYRETPELVVLPTTTEQVRGVVRALPPRRHPLRAARLGHGALGRRAAGGGRRGHRAGAHARDPGD